jgi:hypothetical protein
MTTIHAMTGIMPFPSALRLCTARIVPNHSAVGKRNNSERHRARPREVSGVPHPLSWIPPAWWLTFTAAVTYCEFNFKVLDNQTFCGTRTETHNL